MFRILFYFCIFFFIFFVWRNYKLHNEITLIFNKTIEGIYHKPGHCSPTYILFHRSCYLLLLLLLRGRHRAKTPMSIFVTRVYTWHNKNTFSRDDFDFQAKRQTVQKLKWLLPNLVIFRKLFVDRIRNVHRRFLMCATYFYSRKICCAH